ncbi:NAD(+) synthase [Tessaracoccus oleiagri]|uniref:NH(3)-dependent NAD(+) synthetase n=1 Tax=Tessaracoccus oleiagri TaxID=686624 RepID=A0A1G9N7N0_9ACTN|nr:NAD(+) synthase [Tessaracoccus oleiagri]SDL82542.1 NAD+ synthase [Tessaracoccus oleiagri]
MTTTTDFGPRTLDLDLAAETDRIVAMIRGYLTTHRRKGAVVALSGGIDSSVTAALCVAALGPGRVFGLHMPERASSPETISLSRSISDHFGFDSVVEDIATTLEAVGCYRRYDEAVRRVVPEYGEGWKSKIVLPSVVDDDALRLYSIVVEDPQGERSRHRLTIEAYLGIVAATNFKQRVRKMLEYHHADRLNYVTTGTPNRLEYDQGFFVKLGDGAADIKPIAHLYKTQVYALAEHLGVPEAVRTRPSTTDTYSLAQSQEEFYFSLPHHLMDLCLYGLNHDVPVDQVASATGLTAEQVERVYRDIEQKRRTTAYLHEPPVLVENVPEIHG